jgi:hypothetical protein
MLRLLTPSREGGKPTRPQQITDENQTALPDWESVKHDFVHGDWSQRRIALAHGVSGRTLAARSGVVLSLACPSFARSVYRLLTMRPER